MGCHALMRCIFKHKAKTLEIDGDSLSKPSSSPALKTDALVVGVAVMLAVTVGQRLIGFVRSIAFCRYLEEDQLGVWSLAFSFLMLAAPLAVIGLPGTFGRYVERYRYRGELMPFLRRTTLMASASAVVAISTIFLLRRQFAVWIFNDAEQASLVLALAGALIVLIVFNYANELLIALRQVRAVSIMQFVNSFVFAAIAIGLLVFTRMGPAALVLAYAGSCLVACVIAFWFLRKCWSSISTSTKAPSGLWAKLLPFAAWVWVINLLANLFEAIDRWMIVQFASMDTQSAQALVGQYHSSRVVPVLLIAIAGMLSGVLLPYFTADWEAGRRKQVSRQLNLSLKLVSIAFTACGAMILVASPILFGWIFGGKFDGGLFVLPWTLTYCIWFSLALIAQNYLWCAEKARLVSAALFVGLITNADVLCVVMDLSADVELQELVIEEEIAYFGPEVRSMPLLCVGTKAVAGADLAHHIEGQLSSNMLVLSPQDECRDVLAQIARLSGYKALLA
ncbi:MAG: oligosaccharide flippase family protein, partial [Planctomycetes bacterium]|nr:oligosaccharide flippase family protein [Planctomycetota bacterium]